MPLVFLLFHDYVKKIPWRPQIKSSADQCVTVSLWRQFGSLAQSSGGGCPDETWLSAARRPTKQHHQQPIAGSVTGPWRSSPQGRGMPVKSLVHAYLHKCNRCTQMFYFKGNIVLFLCPYYVYCLRHFSWYYFLVCHYTPQPYQWRQICSIWCCFDMQLQREMSGEQQYPGFFLRISMYFLVLHR